MTIGLIKSLNELFMSIDKRLHKRHAISLKVHYPSLDDFIEDYQ